ncbi:MAG: response regulator [Chrysiogenetes bacterium]|nr:response regulator [Chrysiogenetes bacterium]
MSRQPIVLVVDDQGFHRNYVRDSLECLPVTIVEAEDGQSAIQAASDHKPELILMDRVMPGMDGATAARNLRKIPDLRATSIVAMSANISVDLLKDGTFNGHVPKPIDAAGLRILVCNKLGLAPALAQVAV